MQPLITLASDYGQRDGYVAAMKGVISTVAPGVRILDAIHDIPAFDLRAGSWIMNQYWRDFPEGVVHVAVVDPGVGTDRRALALRVEGRVLVGPDNGLFSWVVKPPVSFEAFALRPDIHVPGVVSHTFHGRDVFAYAAALFASGRMTLEDAGDRVSDIVRGPWVSARKISPQRIEGEIVHVDRFGNCITNLTAQDWAAIQGRTRMLEVRSYYFSRMNRIYGEVERGRKLILVGASGCIEIAIREGHASDRMQLRAGEPVVLNGLD